MRRSVHLDNVQEQLRAVGPATVGVSLLAFTVPLAAVVLAEVGYGVPPSVNLESSCKAVFGTVIRSIVASLFGRYSLYTQRDVGTVPTSRGSWLAAAWRLPARRALPALSEGV